LLILSSRNLMTFALSAEVPGEHVVCTTYAKPTRRYHVVCDHCKARGPERGSNQADATTGIVIGGYTPPEGSRRHFGALLVGYYGAPGFLFAARVGLGYSEKRLADLHQLLQKIKRPTCPFVNLPEKRRGRWGQGITPAVMKRCHWVEPRLVAQIKFTEWTLDD
jgi:ATP dependent DNA ligase C terminal region